MNLLDGEWPDATDVVARYLIAAQDVPVRWAVPNPRPSQFVVVRRVGSGAPLQWADRASLDVECWSGEPNGNPKPAHLLAASIRRTLLAMPDADNPVASVSILGVAYSPDTVALVPRVVLGVEVLLRPSDPLTSA